jgi:outer membrane protein TolC
MTRVHSRRVRSLVLFLLMLTLSAPVTAGAQAPAVPSLLTLRDAITLALQGSTQIGIRTEELSAARKAHRNALFNLGPDLQLSAVRSSSTRRDFDVPFETPTEFRSWETLEGDTLSTAIGSSVAVRDQEEESSFRQAQLSSSIRLFDGFANYARLSAAKHDVHASEHTLQYSRQQVEERVIAAYYNLLRAQLLRGVAQEAEKVAGEQLQRTQALYDLGSAARSDVLKSQVQLGNTRLELVRARNRERQAKLDLEHAMNLDASTPFAIDTTVTQVTIESPAFEAERTYALDNRADLMAFRDVETAASRRVWAARGTLWPTVDFQYNLTQTKSSSQFRFGSSRNRNRSWAFSANWNIWDRYQNYASIGQARANSRIAGYNRRQAELDAVREIRTYVNAIDEAGERLTVSRENVARSQEDLRLAQEKFRVGAGTILDTITAESDLTATRANEVEAIVDYLIGRANLARAAGRSITGP